MNNFFTQLKTIARTLRLSSDEKQRMRFALLTYMQENPLEAKPVKSNVPHSVPSPYLFFSPKFMVPIVLLLIVGLGSGTAFAAEGALPDNPLYAVKVHVNEPLRVALATTPEAKAEVNADIATTRLEEAETLAANGALDASTSQSLADNFSAHASAAVANTNDLSADDPGTAVELGAQFSSTLAAHQAILAQISDDTKGGSGDNSNVIAMAVRAHEHDEDSGDNDNDAAVTTLALATTTTEATATLAVAPAASARTFAAKTNGPRVTSAIAPATSSASTTVVSNPEDAKGAARDQAIATSLQTQASTSIAKVTRDFGTLEPQLDPTLAAAAQVQIANAQKVFAQGSASLTAGNASAAKNQFTTVIRTAVKLDTYLTIGKKINIKLLQGLLGVSLNSGTNTSGKNSDGDTGQGSTNSTNASSASVTPTSNSGSGDGSNSGDSSNSGKGGDDGDSTNVSASVKLHL